MPTARTSPFSRAAEDTAAELLCCWVTSMIKNLQHLGQDQELPEQGWEVESGLSAWSSGG